MTFTAVWSEGSLLHDPGGARSVFFGYDFHLSGDRLGAGRAQPEHGRRDLLRRSPEKDPYHPVVVEHG